MIFQTWRVMRLTQKIAGVDARIFAIISAINGGAKNSYYLDRLIAANEEKARLVAKAGQWSDLIKARAL